MKLKELAEAIIFGGIQLHILILAWLVDLAVVLSLIYDWIKGQL